MMATNYAAFFACLFFVRLFVCLPILLQFDSGLHRKNTAKR